MDREVKRSQPSTVCDECRILYPDPLVAKFTHFARHGEKTEKMLCGVCALALTNKIHGIEREQFPNELAEQKRLAAVQYRAKVGRN